jgi:hypothetical protein
MMLPRLREITDDCDVDFAFGEIERFFGVLMAAQALHDTDDTVLRKTLETKIAITALRSLLRDDRAEVMFSATDDVGTWSEMLLVNIMCELREAGSVEPTRSRPIAGLSKSADSTE